MRLALSVFLLSLAVLAQAAPVEKIYRGGIRVSRLQKTDVVYDTGAKAWVLDLAGEMHANDFIWKHMDPPPVGVTLMVHRPAEISRFDRVGVNYVVELGFVEAHSGVIREIGGATQMAWSYPFEAKLRLPENFDAGDRSLRLIFPSAENGLPELAVILNWDPLKKSWLLAHGATNPPIIQPHPLPLVRLDRFATVLSDFAPSKLALNNVTAPKSVKIEGTAFGSVCPGSTEDSVGAVPQRLSERQLILFQAHGTKDGMLDPWGTKCTPAQVARNTELEAAFPQSRKFDQQNALAEYGQYSLTLRLHGASPKLAGRLFAHTFFATILSGQTDWKFSSYEELVRNP